jgi:hypothetical protein
MATSSGPKSDESPAKTFANEIHLTLIHALSASLDDNLTSYCGQVKNEPLGGGANIGLYPFSDTAGRDF